MNALDADCPGGAPADTTAPTITSVLRQNPATENTDADALTWRVMFSEAVQNVDAADFAAGGTSAAVSGVNAVSGSTYDVTISGGDLAGLVNTVVSLGFAGGQNVQDEAGNALADTTPGTNETYTVNNSATDTTAPTITSVLRQNPATENTDADALTWRVTFSEAVQNVDAADFAAGGTSAAVSGVNAVSGSTYDVTISGGDLAGLVNTVVSLGFAGGQDVQDEAGNALADTTPGTSETYTVNNSATDTTAPTITSVLRQNPATENTDADALTWRVTFSEAVQNVDAGDFAAGGTSAAVSGVNAVSGSTYDVTISGGDLAGLVNTVVSLGFAGGQDVQDEAGNALADTTPAASETYTVDNSATDTTAPTITSVLRQNPATENTDADALTWRVTFSEAVQNVDAGDFAAGGTSAAVSGVNAVSGSTYDVTISGGDLAGLVNTVVSLGFAGGQDVQDEAGNALADTTPAASETYTVDNSATDTTAPTVALTSGATDPVSGAFTITATFSEDVTGFDASDIAVGNGAASDFAATSARVYTATITPAADGPVTVDVAAGAAQDAAGNANTAATQFSIGFDGTPPTVALTSGATDPVSGAFTITATFSEDVTGFDASDIAVGNGAASDFAATSARVYTATITPAADGPVTVDVAAGAAQDAAGNANTAATQFSIGFDGTPPTVALTSGATDPVSGAFTITATFSEDVTGFDASDIAVGNGAASDFAATSARVYTATITPAADGPVTVDVAAGAAQDAAGNANTAATQFSIGFDGTPPTVALTSGATDPVSGAFTITATFSEDVTGFDASDIAVGNGAASDFAATSARVYTATITPAADGPVTVDVAAGAAQDAAGNANTAATQFSIGFDGTPPTVALTSGATDPVSGAFTITATFSEDVTGFDASDIAVGNGAASDFAATSARVYTATITPAADGPVTVDVAAGAAQDAAGNANTAATQFSIGFDGTPPGLTISVPGATAEGPFTATFTFSEAVTGLELGDIAVTNAVASQLSETGAGVYTATITPETIGEVTISVAAGAASDAAGNASEAGDASIEIVFPEVDVALDLASTVLDATTVSQSVTLTNPGSQPLDFVATVDVDWVTVSPASGTVPASGSLDLTITLNELADQLEPGQYTGAVTVSTAPASAPSSAGSSSAGSTVVASIPITASVAARFGSLQIVATTPGGLQGDETFTYASSDTELNGLSLTTSGGTASSKAFRKLFGTYDLAQSLPQGWALESLTCAGDADGGSDINAEAGTVNIDLDAGETIVCTFANARDEDAIRLATMRAINNFMVRRADRIMTGAPDLSTRLRDRQTSSPGRFSADVEGGNVMMNLAGSLSGLRNHAKANERQIPGASQTAEPDDARFDVWFAASYSALDDDRAGDRAESTFGLFQLGADWLVSENALIGVMVQIDEMSETADDLVEAAGAIRGAELEGAGWMAGPYAVWEFAEGTTLDVLALWGQSENTINPLGFYEDEFETTRYMVQANITGEWKSERTRNGQLTVRPGLSWVHFEETQDAYTDSLNIAIPEQTISIGRIEAGPEVAYRMEGRSGQGWWEPNAAVRAVWDYDGADLMDESGRRVDDGQLRADASVGLRGQWGNGAAVSAEARFSGLGDGDFSANSARLELRVPF
jgi:hypothetical protein